MTRIWAHRGASAQAPENTMEAFQKAMDLGAEGIELDVQLSKDQKVVVIHDERIDRTSNGSGYVKDYYYEELMAFDYSNGMPTYTNCKIPLLKDVLSWASANDVYLNIELKTGVFSYHGIEEKVSQLIKEHAMEKRVTISSFNHYSLKRFKAIDPNVRIGVLVMTAMVNPKHYMDSLGAVAYHAPARVFKHQLQEGECFEGVEVSLWYADDLKNWCKSQNVYSVILNDVR